MSLPGPKRLDRPAGLGFAICSLKFLNAPDSFVVAGAASADSIVWRLINMLAAAWAARLVSIIGTPAGAPPPPPGGRFPAGFLAAPAFPAVLVVVFFTG